MKTAVDSWAAWEVPGLPRIYVDLDGVMADFTSAGGRATDQSGEAFDAWLSYGDSALPQWEYLYAICPDFWRTIPPLVSGQMFWGLLQESCFNIWILTASPKAFRWPGVVQDKTAWVERVLRYPPDRVIVTPNSDYKAEYAFSLGVSHLLIDDQKHNISQFEEAGGLGFLYQPAGYLSAVAFAKDCQRQPERV